ncbi:RING finger protein 222 [Dissostichus eleginoides]|uniref:RING finger protein 222 n=1 Tax=Dissostichus eleginoides TaxID=100907 RepID=A0AAD9ET80_DISEL|nr:RING finger protein 222 [Dissostichus eleginoides]
MEFPKEDSQEDAPECPVCYECLSGTERTLSCGHVFCHDAWSKRWEMSERIRRQRLISPSHKASQIFIISAQGRPMAEDDALSVVMTVVPQQRRQRRRRRICTTARCLIVLLSVFTILALVAATLPWILLA